MIEPTPDAQNSISARKLGDTPIGLFATRAHFDRRGRIASKQDLKNHDLIGLDRSELLIRGFVDHGISMAREEFALRTDDGLLTWTPAVGGWGVGIAQTVRAKRHSELEQARAGISLGASGW
jgi:hypothetical protein